MRYCTCAVPFRKKTNKRMNQMSSVNGYWAEKEQVEGATVPGKLITYLDALGECDNPVCLVMDAEREHCVMTPTAFALPYKAFALP